MDNIEEKIAKLPVWARKHIEDLQRERDSAHRALKEFLDTQTPTQIWTERHISDKTYRVEKHFIQDDTVYMGDFYFRLEKNGRIYGSTNQQVIFYPHSTNCFYLKSVYWEG